jgi:prepilin-type N-terminal cleavage/methylation domain-containing protein
MTRAMRISRPARGQLPQRVSAALALQSRRGFSLIETMVASVLAALLGLLLALSCASFGRSAVEVESRARISQEGILAAQSIACDFGGFLADSPGRAGTLAQYSFTNWDSSQGNVLVIYFQGSTPNDLIAISYEMTGSRLVRTNSSTGTSTTIARYVTAFSAEPSQSNPSQVQIQITITYRYFKSTLTLIAESPT